MYLPGAGSHKAVQLTHAHVNLWVESYVKSCHLGLVNRFIFLISTAGFTSATRPDGEESSAIFVHKARAHPPWAYDPPHIPEDLRDSGCPSPFSDEDEGQGRA